MVGAEQMLVPGNAGLQKRAGGLGAGAVGEDQGGREGDS